MKKLIIAAVALTAMFAADAQTFTEWHDPQVNQINRAPMRSAAFAWRDGEEAGGVLQRKNSATI